MNKGLKNAICVSTIIHSAVIAPFLPFPEMRREQVEKKEPLVIDYVLIKETRPPLAQKTNLEIRIVETPRLELKKGAEPSPQAKKEEPARKGEDPVRAQREIEKKEAKIKKTRDYVSYYQAIRERIRLVLKANYKNYHAEGDVKLIFALNSDGTLSGLAIDSQGSTNDATLQSIARSSLKEASPFPPFPRALGLPRMTFNLLVSFKKQ